MSEDLEPLEHWLEGVAGQLGPAERRKLARAIGLELRESQVERIAAQKNPDGTAYAPRKRRAPKQTQKLRGKAGRIKRQARGAAMFRKLRKAAYLKVRTGAADVSVGFFDPGVAAIAQVHQFGLKDRVVRQPCSPEVTYPMRVLLGLTEQDRNALTAAVAKHLGL